MSVGALRLLSVLTMNGRRYDKNELKQVFNEVVRLDLTCYTSTNCHETTIPTFTPIAGLFQNDVTRGGIR